MKSRDKYKLCDPNIYYSSYIIYRYKDLLSRSFMRKGYKLKALYKMSLLNHILSNYIFRKKMLIQVDFLIAKALINITPEVHLRKSAVSGMVFSMPLPLSESKKILLAVRALFFLYRNNKKPIDLWDFSDTLLEAFYYKGKLVQSKEKIHLLAVASQGLGGHRIYK